MHAAAGLQHRVPTFHATQTLTTEPCPPQKLRGSQNVHLSRTSHGGSPAAPGGGAEGLLHIGLPLSESWQGAGGERHHAPHAAPSRAPGADVSQSSTFSSAAATMLRLQSARVGRFSSETGASILRPSTVFCTLSEAPPSGRGFSETGARPQSRPGTAHRARFSGSGCSSCSGNEPDRHSVASAHSGPLLDASLHHSSPGLERLNTISRIRDRVAASARKDGRAGGRAALGEAGPWAATSSLVGQDGLSLPGSRFSSPPSGPAAVAGVPPLLGSISAAVGLHLRPGTACSPLGR